MVHLPNNTWKLPQISENKTKQNLWIQSWIAVKYELNQLQISKVLTQDTGVNLTGAKQPYWDASKLCCIYFAQKQHQGVVCT